LHVKFSAEIFWYQGQTGAEMVTAPLRAAKEAAIAAAEATKNPDEIEIAFDDEDEDQDAGEHGATSVSTDSAVTVSSNSAPAGNPEEIKFDMDDEDEDNDNEDDATKAGQPSKEPKTSEAADPASATLTPGINVPPKGGERSYTSTKFLALDKCEPIRNFLEILEFPEAPGPVEFFYDEEWLAIVRTLDSALSLKFEQNRPMEGAELDQ
jgi:lariat debranching enzyme